MPHCVLRRRHQLIRCSSLDNKSCEKACIAYVRLDYISYPYSQIGNYIATHEMTEKSRRSTAYTHISTTPT